VQPPRESVRTMKLVGAYARGPSFQLGTLSTRTGWPKNSKLSYFVHVFAKYQPIFTIFSPVDSAGNLLLIGMHTTPTMSLHYLVKHKYAKTSNIIQQKV